jgi:hypothetical protein
MITTDTSEPHAGFTADVAVWTEFGPLEISILRPGMRILTRDSTGEPEYVKMVGRSTRNHVATYDLFYVDGEGDVDRPITTTLHHPFMVDGRGWVRAGELKEGDRLLTRDGFVTLWDFADAKQRTAVYQVETDGFHGYFVGGSGLWVRGKLPAEELICPGSHLP